MFVKCGLMLYIEVSKKVRLNLFAPFPNLQIGEVFLKDKDPFTEIIELKGKPYLPDTTIYRVREARMDIVRDKLVLQEQPFIGETAMFRLLNYPDLTYIRSTGNRGNGPGELFSAVFVPSDNTDILGYIYDTTRNKLYKLTEQGDLEEDPFVFRKGKSVFGTIGEMVKSPFTYIGYFGVNKAKNRMVYAYKYFKVLKFIDMETLQVRTLNFQQTEFDQSSFLCLRDTMIHSLYMIYRLTRLWAVAICKNNPAQRQNCAGAYILFKKQYIC